MNKCWITKCEVEPTKSLLNRKTGEKLYCCTKHYYVGALIGATLRGEGKAKRQELMNKLVQANTTPTPQPKESDKVKENKK